MGREEIRFASGEERVRGLAVPACRATDAPVPCVVMGSGLSCVRDQGLDAVAERFAAAGFAALAFDYRHFGDSGGEPRGAGERHPPARRPSRRARPSRARRTERGPDASRSGATRWAAATSRRWRPRARDRRRDLRRAGGQRRPQPAPHRRARPRRPARRRRAPRRRCGRCAEPSPTGSRPPAHRARSPSSTAPTPRPASRRSPRRIDLAQRALRPRRAGAPVQPGPQGAPDRLPGPLLHHRGGRHQPAGAGQAGCGARPAGELRLYPGGHFDPFLGETFERMVADQVEFLDGASTWLSAARLRAESAIIADQRRDQSRPPTCDRSCAAALRFRQRTLTGVRLEPRSREADSCQSRSIDSVEALDRHRRSARVDASSGEIVEARIGPGGSRSTPCSNG